MEKMKGCRAKFIIEVPLPDYDATVHPAQLSNSMELKQFVEDRLGAFYYVGLQTPERFISAMTLPEPVARGIQNIETNEIARD